MAQRIDRLEVAGFLSIEDARVDLNRITVLIGANGSGKSNLIKAFELLGRIVDGDLDLYVGASGGASSLLFRGDRGRDAEAISLHVQGERNGYRARLVPAAGDGLVFGSELVEFHGEGDANPWNQFLGSGHRKSLLSSVDDGPGVPHYVRALLAGCRVFHFQDASAQAPPKKMIPVVDSATLHPNARNLAAVLLRLKYERPDRYDRIVDAIRLVAPYFRDFDFVRSGDNVQLAWRQEGGDLRFPAHALSDGTLRFICLATLFHQDVTPQLVVLDEPELGLHPYAIGMLAELIRSAAQERQVFVATQSVTLLEHFSPDEIVVAERSVGATVYRRPRLDELGPWLEDYSLGELWQMNVVGGRPARELHQP
ncbi:MAG: AAA family ATPase [Kineosporiaceae bacterium]